MNESHISQEIKKNVKKNRRMVEMAEEILPGNNKTTDEKVLDENKKIREKYSISLEAEVVHHQEEKAGFKSNM